MESEKDKYIRLNKAADLPKMNITGNLIVIGCNYHTTWQSHSAMRFVLVSVNGQIVRLKTRTTNKAFTTELYDLIFINTSTNWKKAKELRNNIKD